MNTPSSTWSTIRSGSIFRSGTRCSKNSRRRTPSCASSTCGRCRHPAVRTTKPAGRRSSCCFAEGGAIVAACPLYLKAHSYGEYVFDWAWADAYQRHRLRYYPKLLDAVPFTPVPGARLLAGSQADRQLLLQAMQQFAREANLSSAHLLFLDDADQAAARASGWMMRSTVQFHWTNREPTPYADFAGLPLQPAAREAQEDPAGAPPGRRSRRHVRGEGRHRDRRGRLGLLLPLLCIDLPGAPLDPVPDARLLRAHATDDGIELAAVHRVAATASGSPHR